MDIISPDAYVNISIFYCEMSHVGIFGFTIEIIYFIGLYLSVNCLIILL